MPVHVFEKVREDMGVLPGNTRSRDTGKTQNNKENV